MIRTKINDLIAHDGFRRYAGNTSWLLAEKILRIFVGLFVGVWVARYLGPSQFGVLSYAQSFVGLFTAFATLGLDGIVVRELVKNEARTEEIIGTAFVLKLCGALCMLFILAFAVNFTSNNSQTNLLVFIIASATVFQSFNVIDFYFQSKVLSRYIVFTNFFGLLLSSIVKIVLILNSASVIAFSLVIVFDSLILAIGFIYFFIKQSEYNYSKLKYSSVVAKKLLRDSWPLILSGIVVSIYMKIDQVMIKEILGNSAVGHYAAALRISEAWYFIPAIVASSLFPAIMNAKSQNEALYYERIQKLFDFLVCLALLVSLPVTFASNLIVVSLFGAQYGDAGIVLMVHIWSSVFVFLGVASSKWFIAENLQKLFFWRSFYGMIINITFNLLLIPLYGIYGAAIATLLSQIMATYVFDFFNKKTRVIFIMKSKAFFFFRRIT